MAREREKRGSRVSVSGRLNLISRETSHLRPITSALPANPRTCFIRLPAPRSLFVPAAQTRVYSSLSIISAVSPLARPQPCLFKTPRTHRCALRVLAGPSSSSPRPVSCRRCTSGFRDPPIIQPWPGSARARSLCPPPAFNLNIASARSTLSLVRITGLNYVINSVIILIN